MVPWKAGHWVVQVGGCCCCWGWVLLVPVPVPVPEVEGELLLLVMGEGSNQMVLKIRPGVKKRLGLATIWNSGAGEVRGVLIFGCGQIGKLTISKRLLP